MSGARRLLWPVAFWAVLIVGAAAWAVLWVADTHRRSAAAIGDMEPRFARLTGLGAKQASLEEAAARIQRSLGKHAYPADRDASQSGNDAQQRVREVFSKAGLDVLSIQVIAARRHASFDVIPISMRVDGEYGALQSALAALPETQPTIFVSGFAIQGATGAAPEKAPVRAVAELQLFVLRVNP